MKFDFDAVKEAEENFEEKAYNFDENAELVAKERGLIVIFPKPNQLQFDLDTEESYQEFERRLYWFGFDKGTFTKEVHASNSGLPHRHVTLTFNGITFTEVQRICLQAVLGSDIIREYLNAKRLWANIPNPTRLFEKEKP
jgi:hypothetical protein